MYANLKLRIDHGIKYARCANSYWIYGIISELIYIQYMYLYMKAIKESNNTFSSAICTAIESVPSSFSPFSQRTKPPNKLREALPIANRHNRYTV